MCATVVVTAAGGLFAAGVVKHLDNIAKIYCAAIASVAVGVATSIVYPSSFMVGAPFMGGMVMVIVSAVVYARPTHALPPSQSVKRVVAAV